MNPKLADGLNFLSKQTPVRLWNTACVLGSFQAARLSGRTNPVGLPISLSIEPTTSCNLRCPECPSGLRSFTRPTGMMKTELFHSVLAQVAPTLSYLIFYFQGEPYLHPQLLDMVQLAAQKSIYTATSTNGHYLSEEAARQTVASGLDRLIISIDGTTQETYQSYRVGGKMEKVIQGTENILRWKRDLKSQTPHVIFQFLVVRQNEHQIEDVRRLATRLGVDELRLKTAQIYDFENGSDLMPLNDRYNRYQKKAGGQYEIKNRLDDECWKMWHSCVITWDGKVVPCCFDKDAHYVLGDLNRQTFQEIWQGDSYREFRKSLFEARSKIEMCRNCTEGAQVFA